MRGTQESSAKRFRISKHFLSSRISLSSSVLSVGKTGLLLATLSAVWLDVGAGAAGSSEVLLGLSGSVGSQQESVGT